VTQREHHAHLQRLQRRLQVVAVVRLQLLVRTEHRQLAEQVAQVLPVRAQRVRLACRGPKGWHSGVQAGAGVGVALRCAGLGGTCAWVGTHGHAHVRTCTHRHTYLMHIPPQNLHMLLAGSPPGSGCHRPASDETVIPSWALDESRNNAVWLAHAMGSHLYRWLQMATDMWRTQWAAISTDGYRWLQICGPRNGQPSLQMATDGYRYVAHAMGSQIATDGYRWLQICGARNGQPDSYRGHWRTAHTESMGGARFRRMDSSSLVGCCSSEHPAQVRPPL